MNYVSFPLKDLDGLRRLCQPYLDLWDKKTETIFQVEQDVLDWLNKQLPNKPPAVIASIFIRCPDSTQIIHVDHDLEKRVTPFAINVPLYGTERSSMKWYSGNFTKEVRAVHGEMLHKHGGIKKARLNNQYVELVSFSILTWADEPKVCDQLELLTPHLVAVGVPHSIEANGKDARIIISFRYAPDIQMDSMLPRNSHGL